MESEITWKDSKGRFNQKIGQNAVVKGSAQLDKTDWQLLTSNKTLLYLPSLFLILFPYTTLFRSSDSSC